MSMMPWRPPQSENPLIGKPGIGEARKNCIPFSENMEHGMKSIGVDDGLGGVAGSISNWDIPSPSPAPQRAAPLPEPKDDVRVGVVRASMSSNILLARPLLGKSIVADRPPVAEDTSFGVASHSNGGGVAAAFAAQAAIASSSSSPAKTARRSKSAGSSSTARGTNFVAMNKVAVRHGLVSVKDQSRSRAFVEQEARAAAQKPPPITPAGAPIELGLTAPGGGAFGTASDPVEPMAPLFAHDYGKEAYAKELARAKHDAEVRRRKQTKSQPTNRTTMLRQKVPEPESRSMWNMDRYADTDPVVDTFRTDSARQRAYKYASSDAESRLGYLGQGTRKN